MKKFVRIEHIRCGEFEGYTYLLAPENITQEQFEKDVDTATQNYFKAKEEFKKMSDKPKYVGTGIADFPEDMTIKEAKELYNKLTNERWNWESKERQVSKSFGFWMTDLGYLLLGDIEDGYIIETFVNWGHRHGEHIDYSLTDTDCKFDGEKR
jgi:hypothetical protein